MYTLNKLIGQGIKFPYFADQRGTISLSREIERINQSLFLLFETPKGSRLMLPEYGSDLYKYKFEPNDAILQEQIRYSVVDDVSRWEPRINVLDVSFYNDPHLVDNSVLYISVKYRVVNTDIEGNFVYPFKTETYDTVESTDNEWGSMNE